MIVESLIDAFERGEIEPARFRHRDHLHVAWTLLERYPRPEAARRLLDGLRALALRAGRADRFDARLSVAWLDLIAAARADQPPPRTFEGLLAIRPDLLDPRAIRRAP